MTDRSRTADAHRLQIVVAEGAFVDLPAIERQYADRAQFIEAELASPEQVAAATATADGVAVGLHPMRAAHIAAFGPRVRALSRAGVGLDSIDLDAAEEHGLAVIFQPAYATNEVADHAAALALAAWRRIPRADALVRERGWATAQEVGVIGALQDATLGVLGTGRIGRAAIERLRPFVARVVAYDPYPGDELPGVERLGSVDEVLSVADILTLHLPLTSETHHLIDARRLALMRPGSVVVNVSRGGLIDESALAAALHDGTIRAAGIDVFETEPLAAESPLRTAPHAILAPHLAWYSDASGARLAEWTVGDLLDYLESDRISHGAWAVAPRV